MIRVFSNCSKVSGSRWDCSGLFVEPAKTGRERETSCHPSGSSSRLPVDVTAALPMTFSNSRTLPGQLYSCRAKMTSGRYLGETLAQPPSGFL